MPASNESCLAGKVKSSRQRLHDYEFLGSQSSKAPYWFELVRVTVSGSGNGRSVHGTRMSEHMTPEGRTRIQNLDRRSGMSLYKGYRETCRRMALDRKNPQAHCLLQQVYRDQATARETTRTTVNKPARAGSSTLVWTSHARIVFLSYRSGTRRYGILTWPNRIR